MSENFCDFIENAWRVKIRANPNMIIISATKLIWRASNAISVIIARPDLEYSYCTIRKIKNRAKKVKLAFRPEDWKKKLIMAKAIVKIVISVNEYEFNHG